MAETILTHIGKIESVDREQVLRYAGMMGTRDEIVEDLIDKCCPTVLNAAKPKACYLETDVSVDIMSREVDLGFFKVTSLNLSKILNGCDKAILTAATLGPHVDMIIRRALVYSKAEALILNAIAVAAIEKYMATLNEEFKKLYSGYELRPRYSPGYGDLPLETQIDLLRVLDSNRKIGVALSDSLLMTPEKTVSAIIGIAENGCIHIDKDCDICSKTDCEFRLGAD